MLIKAFFSLVFFCFYVTPAFAQKFGSENMILIENSTGEVLLEKNANEVVPIASLTKLMTAMVILDGHPKMDEVISIEQADVDTLKHSRSRLPVGLSLTRREVLKLALMSSDNRAAAALARNYPGGNDAFALTVKAKIASLGMKNTVIQEPTGLSPENVSTASDLVKMAMAASRYPQITDITTDNKNQVTIRGRTVNFRNTNRLVGKKGWDILLSKTGFTNEAGNCVIMQIQLAKKKATLVLLNAGASSARWGDVLKIRSFLQTYAKLNKNTDIATLSKK
jgi:D-alanyl-D-alanine endopeptidase (penicillin-binding protein 7)